MSRRIDYTLVSFFGLHLYSVKSGADFLPGIDARRLRFFISLSTLCCLWRNVSKRGFDKYIWLRIATFIFDSDNWNHWPLGINSWISTRWTVDGNFRFVKNLRMTHMTRVFRSGYFSQSGKSGGICIKGGRNDYIYIYTRKNATNLRVEPRGIKW